MVIVNPAFCALFSFLVRRLGHAYELYPLFALVGIWFLVFCYTVYYTFEKVEIWLDRSELEPSEIANFPRLSNTKTPGTERFSYFQVTIDFSSHYQVKIQFETMPNNMKTQKTHPNFQSKLTIKHENTSNPAFSPMFK